jgi:hypothetical protein
MKKITLFLIAGFFAGAQLNAQTAVQSEDFTTYLGTAATVPSGWVFTYNGNYTSTASSGTSGPNSYKFGQTVTAPPSKITSPMFILADSLSFWIKGNSTDTISTFVVMQSADNVIWDTIAKINPIPTTTTGQTYSFAVAPTSHYIGFAYLKSAGNVAFDDYRLFLTGPTSVMSHTNASVISISPNPGTGLFMVNREEQSPALLTVYNVTGKKIMERTITGKQSLDLTPEPNGCYFVTIKTDKELITKKIIINK